MFYIVDAYSHSMIYILRLIATTTRQAQEIKKYSEYFLNVDPDQDDKATEIKLLSFKRPHMRLPLLMVLLLYCILYLVCHRATPTRSQGNTWPNEATGLDIQYLLCRWNNLPSFCQWSFV